MARVASRFVFLFLMFESLLPCILFETLFAEFPLRIPQQTE